MGGPGSGRKTSSGRQPGAKGRVTDAMRLDVLESYSRLGGVRFLEKFGRTHPEAYVSKVLAAILPAPPRDEDAPAEPVNPVSLRDVAIRLNFILASSGVKMVGLDEPADVVELPAPDSVPFPYRPPPEQQDLPPLDEAPVMEPAPIADPENIQATRTQSLENYRGSPGEQGRETRATSDPRSKVGGRRKEARDAFLAARKRDLL